MLRKHKIILVSHCVLNQNAVVKPLARDNGAFKDIVNLIVEQGFGVLQLPCPETLMYGMLRPPMSKQEYNTPAYLELCANLAHREQDMIEKFISGDIIVAGIIGIDQSPTCSQFGDTGHFMHALNQFDVISSMPKIDIPETYEINTQEAVNFHESLKIWLSKF